MKKLLITAVTAACGALAWRRAQQTRAEQRLWSEATDPVRPTQG